MPNFGHNKSKCLNDDEKQFAIDLYNWGLTNFTCLTKVINNKYGTNYSKYYVRLSIGATDPVYKRTNKPKNDIINEEPSEA